MDTQRLTRALGWSAADGMVQQDATELLLEALGGALRPADVALQGLFTRFYPPPPPPHSLRYL